MSCEVRRYPGVEELTRDAAALFCAEARAAVAERGRCTVALSGGRTPQRLYETLGRPPYDVAVPWSQVHLFWGDERCVPAVHPDSNFALAQTALLHRVAPPPAHVHRTPAELGPPSRAAEAWEKDLRAFFGGDGPPSFDLVLLGLGVQGDTASLFPGDPACEEQARWTAAVTEPRGEPRVARLTLTLPVLNAARTVVFLVSGPGKGEVVRAILGGEAAAAGYPAARVRPRERLVWFVNGAFL
ncbi:MAG: 6-phosphogluconolactonase [Deferrisomatales bacterium]